MTKMGTFCYILLFFLQFQGEITHFFIYFFAQKKCCMLNTFNALFIVKYKQTRLIRLFLLGKMAKTTLKTHKL